MNILVIQTVTRQWDKSQRSAEHTEARQQLPDRYPVDTRAAESLLGSKLVLEQHGDDTMGDRVKYQLMDDDKLIIDRFGFDLKNKTVAYFPPKEANASPKQITTMNDGWIQCQYEWRYRVFEGGFYYWLYEQFTINVRFVETLSDDVFTSSGPEFIFKL